MPGGLAVRGIDDKRRLLAFFGAKQHKNLVLRVVDVIELRNEYQDQLIDETAVRENQRSGRSALMTQMLILKEKNAPGWRKNFIMQNWPGGWIVLPIDRLLEEKTMEQVEYLQEIVFAYADIRRQKGEPCRVDVCDKCRGSGTIQGRRCKDCDSGQVITFIEMSPEEIAFAEQEAH